MVLGAISTRCLYAMCIPNGIPQGLVSVEMFYQCFKNAAMSWDPREYNQ